MERENCFRCQLAEKREVVATHKVTTVFFFDGTDEDFTKDFTFKKILEPNALKIFALAFVMAEGPPLCADCIVHFKNDVISNEEDERRYIRNMYVQFIRQMGDKLSIESTPSESSGKVLLSTFEEFEAVKSHVSRLNSDSPDMGLKSLDKERLNELIAKMHCGNEECVECSMKQVLTVALLDKLSSKPQELCNFVNGLMAQLMEESKASGVTEDGKLDLDSVISADIPEDIDYDDLFRKPRDKRTNQDRLHSPRLE